MNEAEKKILQSNLARFLVADVFNTITDEDILRIKAPNVWEYKGKELNEGQVKALRAEAEIISKTKLWGMLKDEITWYAQKNTLEKGKTESDLVAGKLLIYFKDILDSRLKKMLEI